MGQDQLNYVPEHERALSVIHDGLVELDNRRPFQFPLQAGDHIRALSSIMQDTASQIVAAAPTLGHDTAGFLAWGAIPNIKQQAALDALTPGQIERIFDVAFAERDRQVIELSSEIATEQADVMLEAGLLTIPPYKQQQQERSCMGATFLSMFEAITGIAIEEDDFMQLAREIGFLTSMDAVSEEVLALFMTDTFKRAFPDVKVGVFTVGGFDLGQIRREVDEARIEAARQGKKAEVYFLPGIRSEVFDGRDVFHITTLLAADEHTVVLHDPSNVVGAAFRAIDKDEFMMRWGQDFFRGKLVLVYRPQ